MRGFWGTFPTAVCPQHAALISMCIHIAAICIPTSVATFSFHSSCVREFQRDKVSGAGSFPPHPTGTRHPFDQVATCPPAVKQSTGEPQGRSFPWGVKCPIRSRGLCTEAPGSVWLPAGPRRTVWTHPLNKRVTGAAVSSSPVNKYQRALSAAGIIDQPLNSASGSRCCNSHRALPAAER